jgi:hypothetical protein
MWMLLVVLALSTGQADPVKLVDQLGSPRFSEREEAAEALKRLGAEALPALRNAMQNDDMERRSRATALVTEIEARVMVEPTLVKLAYHDRPLLEVVADLGNQSDVTISLFPENAPGWAEKRVTLETAGPVSFWEAIERLCREANLVVSNAPFPPQMVPNAPARKRRAGTLQLFQSSGVPGPSGVNGPFRAVATNILHHRDRVFAQNGFPMMPQGVIVNGQVPRPNRLGQAGAAAQPGATTETFGVGIQINSEPRLSLMQNGALKLLEAVDEQGRSLVPLADPAAANRFQGALSFNGMAGGSALQFPMMLNLPDPPGKFVKRLRLSVPVVVMSRHNEPFVIPLAGSKGKTFESPAMTLQIHEIKTEPNQQFATIELTVKMRHDEATNNPNQGPFGQEFTAFRFNPGQSQNQVEIADAQGRLYMQWFPLNPQAGNDGLRMILRLMPSEGVGPPTEIRLYELGRAETEAIVELHDIPMP